MKISGLQVLHMGIWSLDGFLLVASGIMSSPKEVAWLGPIGLIIKCQ